MYFLFHKAFYEHLYLNLALISDPGGCWGDLNLNLVNVSALLNPKKETQRAAQWVGNWVTAPVHPVHTQILKRCGETEGRSEGMNKIRIMRWEARVSQQMTLDDKERGKDGNQRATIERSKELHRWKDKKEGERVQTQRKRRRKKTKGGGLGEEVL